MSKAVRWQVPFKTLSGQNAVVSIYEEGYAGEVVTLQAGSTPFVTQDDDDEDMLCPVRTQTGYLRVMNDGNLDGLMPSNDMEHQVILTVGGTLRWIGWMQSGQYGRQMYVPNEEVSFALIDPLAALDGVEMDSTTEKDMQWLGSLVYEAVAAMDLSETLTIVWPTEWTDTNSDPAAWLKLAVSRYNFFVENDGENTDDADYTKYDTISYKELLSDICSMMGWTATIHGTELRLVSPFASGYVEVDEQELYDAMTGGVLPTATSTTIQDSEWAVTTDDSGGADNQEETILGYKGVKIAANVNAISDVEGVEVKTSGLAYVRQMSDLSIPTGIYLRVLGYESGQREEGYTGAMILYHHYGTYSNDSVQWTETPYNSGIDTYNNDAYVTTQVVKYDKYTESDLADKTSYAYTDGILVRHLVPYDSSSVLCDGSVPIVTFYGTALPTVENGCIDIMFDYVSVSTTDIVSNASVVMKLQIGSHYWNGTEWTETESLFTATEVDGSLQTTKTLNDDYDGATGFIIPINLVLSGKVILTIYNSTGITGVDAGSYILKGVSLSYCPPSSAVLDITKSVNYYYATVSNGYKERKSIDLSLSTKTDRCRAGLGILAYDGAVFEEGDLLYDGVAAIPEKVLLSKAKEIYCRATEKIRPVLKLGASEVPGVGEICTYDSVRYEVLGRSTDWRMERVTVMCEAVAE